MNYFREVEYSAGETFSDAGYKFEEGKLDKGWFHCWYLQNQQVPIALVETVDGRIVEVCSKFLKFITKPQTEEWPT